MDEYGPIIQEWMQRIEEIFGRIALDPPARGQKRDLKLYTFHETAEKFDRECRYYCHTANTARLKQEYGGFAAYLSQYFEYLQSVQ